jgi:hypothetical protein
MSRRARHDDEPVSGEKREPGWYPDPWGTDDERYFDGGAWTRSVRHPGGLQTPPDPALASTGPVPAAPVVDAPAGPATPPAPAPGVPATAPPGWHPDPWAAASLRYWDGRQWTGHVSGLPGGPSPALRLDEERTAARWARTGLAWGGPALGVTMIAAAFQWRWMADHWDELTRPGGTIESSGNSGAAVVGQLAAVALLASAVLFLIWFYRAAVLALASGLPARRSPVLATLSFFIPVLNVWWPYQSACDLLPQDHPGRAAVRRWWFLWLAFWIGFWAVLAAAFQSVVVLAATTGVTVVVALLAAIAGRNVVTEVLAAHTSLD